MAEVLAELVAKIKADTTQFKQGTKSAETSMGRLKSTVSKHSRAIGVGMAAMGAVIVGAMAKSIKSYADAGDAVQKMALRTGFSTEMLSELRHAADLSGTSLGAIDKASKRMSKTIVDATEGMTTYIRAFDRIGLSAEDLIGLKPEEQFDRIAMAIAGLEDHALKAATAQDIFGRAGTELLPMLAAGAEGLAEMRQEAHTLGLVFDQEAADKAAKLKDDLTRLKGSIQGVAIAIAGPLIDALEPAINFIKETTIKVREWMKLHPGLTKVIALTATGLGLLLIPLGTLLILLPGLKTIILGMRTAFLALNASLGPVGWALLAVGAAAAILIPLILRLTSATKDAYEEMDEYSKALFQNKLMSHLTSEEWVEAYERGYLLESQIKRLATGLQVSTEELLANMKAAGMLETVMVSSTETGRVYINQLEESATGLEAVRQKTLEAAQAQLELAAAQEEAATRAAVAQEQLNESWEDFLLAVQPSTKAFRKFGLTAEDVTHYMMRTGRSITEVIDDLKAQGIAVNNVQYHLDELGISAQDVADYVGKKARAVRDETEADKEATVAVTELGESYDRTNASIARTTESLKDHIAATAKSLATTKTALGVAAAGGATAEERVAGAIAYRQARMEAAQEIAAKYGVSLNVALSWLGATIPSYKLPEYVTGGYYKGKYVPPLPPPWEWSPAPHLQHGGIVTKPTTALLGEAGPEAVIPLGKGGLGGITINFTQPVFFDREDTMNTFVEKIRQGIRRADRLNFGGAYSG